MPFKDPEKKREYERNRKRENRAARRPVIVDPPKNDDWIKHGNCRGMDPNLFFPGRGESRLMDQAKAVCRGCPVRRECLEYALAFEAEAVDMRAVGVFGGKSARERIRIRASRQRVAGVRQDIS